jgi:GNAT superfamily N-acetyltransferase
MDQDHLWPGFPIDCDALPQLMAQGFEASGGHCDMERDLADYRPLDGSLLALADCRATVEPACFGDLEALDVFLGRVFPGRWRHDTLRKATIDQEIEDIVLLWIGDSVQGFALTQLERAKRPIGGAVWRPSLGRSWGALGPIGIAPEARGRGLGHALLASALVELRGRGARRTIIDWTTLESFYGAHGFLPTRRYVTLLKRLAG